MKNIIITFFIVILTFTNCAKKNESEETIQNNLTIELPQELSQVNINNDKIINNYVDDEMIFDDTFDDAIKSIYDNPLNDIGNFIINDLNIKFKYESLQILFEALRLTENEILNGYTVLEHGLYQSHDGFMNYHIIRIGNYILNIISNDDIIKDNKEIFFSAIEIELNNENYLNLFPYNTKNEYMLDDNFGRKIQIKDDYIHYYVDDEWGPGVNCYLIFNEMELLKSIKMSFYMG